MRLIVLNDHGFVNGGAAKIAIASLNALADADFDVTFASSVGPVDQSINRDRVKVINFGFHGLVDNPSRVSAAFHGIWDQRCAKRFREILDEFDPTDTIIHLHTWVKSLSSSVIREATRRHFKVVCTLHDYFMFCPNGGLYNYQQKKPCDLAPMSFACLSTNCDSRNYAQKIWRVVRLTVQRKFGRLPDSIKYFIIYSDYSALLLQPWLPQNAKVFRVHNPIDIEKAPPSDLSNNSAFTFIGRFSPEKGAAVFAAAAKLANVRAVFVGSGSEERNITKINPSAAFYGWQDRLGIIRAMRSSRAIVFPSLWHETYGLVVTEAAALGLPAIVSDACAARDGIIDGKTGLLFRSGKVEDLAAKLKLLNSDLQFAQSLGKAAYERYWTSPCTLDKHVNELVNSYRQIIPPVAGDSCMRKQHILFIMQGGKGGTQEYIKMLLMYLNRDRYVITVICHGETYEELKILGYNVHYVEMVRDISVWKDLISLKNMLSYFKNNKTDIVYSHSSKGGVLGRIAAGLFRTPNLYNPHGWSFNMKISNRKKLFYILVEKIVSKFTDKIIMISEAEYNDALLRGIADRNKLVLITNGIDLAKFNKINGDDFKKSLNIPIGFKVVGMMGRLTEQKSPQTFIEIAKIVTASYPKCKFILIGDGELKKPLEEMILKLNLAEKVLLVGWVNDSERYISIMDIGVLTSKWEGFGLVLAEMMASGKPVVASEVDGIPFVVRKNIDGFLCKPDDVKEFAEHVLRLLKEDDLYKTMSESAYNHAREKFDLKRVIRQHETIFDSF